MWTTKVNCQRCFCLPLHHDGRDVPLRSSSTARAKHHVCSGDLSSAGTSASLIGASPNLVLAHDCTPAHALALDGGKGCQWEAACVRRQAGSIGTFAICRPCRHLGCFLASFQPTRVPTRLSERRPETGRTQNWVPRIRQTIHPCLRLRCRREGGVAGVLQGGHQASTAGSLPKVKRRKPRCCVLCAPAGSQPTPRHGLTGAVITWASSRDLVPCRRPWGSDPPPPPSPPCLGCTRDRPVKLPASWHYTPTGTPTHPSLRGRRFIQSTAGAGSADRQATYNVAMLLLYKHPTHTHTYIHPKVCRGLTRVWPRETWLLLAGRASTWNRFGRRIRVLQQARVGHKAKKPTKREVAYFLLARPPGHSSEDNLR